jgi:hypothetical protein
MARSQNAPRGLFAKARIDIGNLELTYNSTNKGLAFTNGDDTHASALPGNVTVATNPVLIPISNSTGRCYGVNTTGTTWLFLAGTSLQPTT